MLRSLRSPGVRLVLVSAVCLCSTALPTPAVAQDVPTLLIHARLRRIAQEAAEERGIRLRLREMEPLHPRFARTAVHRLDLESDVPTAPSPMDSMASVTFEVVSRIRRPVFSSRFADVDWAFFQGKMYGPLDTTRTIDLRARLEAHFGAPTQTLAELDSVEARPAEEIVQFEYWFVVNDSIPFLALDSNGPLERGLVVASDSRYRDHLGVLRGLVLDRLFDTNRRAPFVDYWYRTRIGEWSAVGFDGATFFDRRIAPPKPGLGRPVLSEFIPEANGR